METKQEAHDRRCGKLNWKFEEGVAFSNFEWAKTPYNFCLIEYEAIFTLSIFPIRGLRKLKFNKYKTIEEAKIAAETFLMNGRSDGLQRMRKKH